MQIIAIANPKGGVGKTTSAVNLAGCAAGDQKRVLLIDMDPNRSATMILGAARQLSEREQEERNAGRMFAEDDQVKKPSELAVPLPDVGIDLVPGSYDLAKCESWLMEHEEGALHLMDLFEDDDGLDAYDYVFIDTGGRVGRMLFTILMASDRVITPTIMSELSRDQILHFLPFVQRVQTFKGRFNPAAKNKSLISHIFITQARGNTKAFDEGVSLLLTMLDGFNAADLLAESAITQSTEFENAALQKKLLVQFSPQHKVSKEYHDLYVEIIRDYQG